MTNPATPGVIRVFVRKPGGRWKLLGEFTDRAVGFAAADGWPIVYLNDQPTADPPPGFETMASSSPGAGGGASAGNRCRP